MTTSSLHPPSLKLKLLLANPRGFCAGVERAITIVERALALFDPPIYVHHEVVHNRAVVERLRSMGVCFTDTIGEIPKQSIVIFSAHGVSQAIRKAAKERQLCIWDATCPLVTKVHFEVKRYAKSGMECILIGHAGHPEVEGTLGQYQTEAADGGIHLIATTSQAEQLELKNPKRCGYVTQTTLSVEETKRIISILKARFPSIQAPRRDDICYATHNRQQAVKALAAQCHVIVVVGSFNSSNSNRLQEVAQKLGCRAYLVENNTVLKRHWFKSHDTVGITAGASAPECLVQGVVCQLKKWGVVSVQDYLYCAENRVFALPHELR